MEAWLRQERTSYPAGCLPARWLRGLLLAAMAGLAFAFVFSLTFSRRLFALLTAPAARWPGATLVQISPVEGFEVVWIKLPLLAALFLASPWIAYRTWRALSPAADAARRRGAAWFTVSTAGAFLLGGAAGCAAFLRLPRLFLRIDDVTMIGVGGYFELLAIAAMGLGFMFCLPVLAFHLGTMRLVSPVSLLAFRWPVLPAFALAAALVSPAGDVFETALLLLPLSAGFYAAVMAVAATAPSARALDFARAAGFLALDCVLGLVSAAVAIAV